jgi:hypothetical protein
MPPSDPERTSTKLGHVGGVNRTVRYLLGIWLTFLSAGGIAVARATDAPPATSPRFE